MDACNTRTCKGIASWSHLYFKASLCWAPGAGGLGCPQLSGPNRSPQHKVYVQSKCLYLHAEWPPQALGEQLSEGGCFSQRKRNIRAQLVLLLPPWATGDHSDWARSTHKEALKWFLCRFWCFPCSVLWCLTCFCSPGSMCYWGSFCLLSACSPPPSLDLPCQMDFDCLYQEIKRCSLSLDAVFVVPGLEWPQCRELRNNPFNCSAEDKYLLVQNSLGAFIGKISAHIRHAAKLTCLFTKSQVPWHLLCQKSWKTTVLFYREHTFVKSLLFFFPGFGGLVFFFSFSWTGMKPGFLILFLMYL